MLTARQTPRAKRVKRADLRIDALGSGSDYTPFLQHLGIASLNIGFGGEDGGGSYHSVYDSFDHYTRFGDPNFDYGIALAKLPDARLCGWQMPMFCRLNLRILPIPSAFTSAK
jgi:N-acetylated-alpha-linked acidic dipeptidase